MTRQWHIKVNEKRPKTADRALLLQGILALARHLESKRQGQEGTEKRLGGDES